MKKLLAVILSVIMVFSFAACAGKSANNEGESQTEETTTIRIGAMAGPTAMGMVKLRKDSENGNTKNTYAFEDFATDASAFVTPLATGEIDIAAVPSNLAANIYNKTQGKVQVVAVNTLGGLNLVERGNTVNSISDLKGKTIYATGMGAVPEYTIRYILSGNGLDADKDVNIAWCSDTTEALKKFIDEYNESVAYTSSNIDETAQLIAEYGIVASEAIAKKALPKCHIVCYINNNMRSALEGFLQVLYDQNPKSVGGSMPKDDFYYEY